MIKLNLVFIIIYFKTEYMGCCASTSEKQTGYDLPGVEEVTYSEYQEYSSENDETGENE